MRRHLLATVAAVASFGLPAGAQADTAHVVSTGNQLLSFDTFSPGTMTAQRAITGLGVGETVQGLDYRPADRQLYAFAVPTAAAIETVRTYTLDPATGAATLVGPSRGSAIAEVPAGYGYDAVLDRVRRVDTNDRNFRLRPDGAFVSDTSLAATNTPDVVGLAFDRSFQGATLSTAFAIDRTGSRLDRIGGVDGFPSASSGIVTPIGAFGVTIKSTADAGFDISVDGRAFAALTGEADSLTRLYKIDLATGAATAVGSIGAGDKLVSSLALVPGTEKLAPDPPAAPPPPPLAPPTPADTTRPAGLIDVTPLGLRTLLASRATVLYWVSEACKVSVELRAGGKLVASGSASPARSGVAKLRLKATAAGKRALARTRRVKGSLRLTLIDAAGNRAVITRALTLRR